jgi:hypothetical protein
MGNIRYLKCINLNDQQRNRFACQLAANTLGLNPTNKADIIQNYQQKAGRTLSRSSFWFQRGL